MKGKITKDILLRVGQGVMRIPRDKAESAQQKPDSFSPSVPDLQEPKKKQSSNKLGHS